MEKDPSDSIPQTAGKFYKDSVVDVFLFIPPR